MESFSGIVVCFEMNEAMALRIQLQSVVQQMIMGKLPFDPAVANLHEKLSGQIDKAVNVVRAKMFKK